MEFGSLIPKPRTVSIRCNACMSAGVLTRKGPLQPIQPGLAAALGKLESIN